MYVSSSPVVSDEKRYRHAGVSNIGPPGPPLGIERNPVTPNHTADHWASKFLDGNRDGLRSEDPVLRAFVYGAQALPDDRTVD